MKSATNGFLLTALATFVSGVALLLFEQQLFDDGISKESLDSKKIALVANDDTIILPPTAQKEIANFYSEKLSHSYSSEEAKTLSIGVATIENTGTVDLGNFNVTLKSNISPGPHDIIAFGPYQTGDDIGFENFTRELGDGSQLLIGVDVLKPNEKIRFWYLMSPFNLSKLTVREPGIEVSNEIGNLPDDKMSLSLEDRATDSIDTILYVLIFSVASFFLGVGIIASFYDKMMKTIGFDPKEISDMYKKATKKD